MKNLILVLLTSLIFLSCEKGTTFKYEVANKSGKAIVFKSQNNFTGTEDSTTIEVGQTKTVLFFDQQGLFDDNFKCGQLLDSVWLRTLDSSSYTGPDLSLSEGWSLSESSNSGGDVKDCSCQLESSDFK